MAHELFVVPDRRHGAPVLRPFNRAGVEALEALPQIRAGAFRCVLTAPRHVRRSMWFHALLGKVAEGYGVDMEAVKIWLKFRVGLTDPFRVGEEIVQVPRSVSFAAMDEIEFSEFCNRCVEVICRELLGGMETGALKREIEEMVGIRKGGRAA